MHKVDITKLKKYIKNGKFDTQSALNDAFKGKKQKGTIVEDIPLTKVKDNEFKQSLEKRSKRGDNKNEKE